MGRWQEYMDMGLDMGVEAGEDVHLLFLVVDTLLLVLVFLLDAHLLVDTPIPQILLVDEDFPKEKVFLVL
ncbi:hypothetical protein AB4X15_07545 [Peribacillus simplex]|uniref:hypothetical protein n=1 Tax=Peribacillus simplex TaxID=1478 RepID=UPI0034E8A9DB